MVHMNVFDNDAFGLVTMTEAMEHVEYRPGLLGSLGMFTPDPITTTSVSIEEREAGALELMLTSPRGAPLSSAGRERRKMRIFPTFRLAKEATINAEEVAGVRAFGSETDVETAMGLVSRRLTGPGGLVPNLELTFERMRLGALRGKMVDGDGSELVNFATEFGVALPTEVNFALTTTTTDVRLKCGEVIRGMSKAAKGAFGPGTEIHAVCGDTFFDKLITHAKVEATYLQWQAAAELRAATVAVNPAGLWASFRFGGVMFHNYRGTDDGTTLGVPADKCWFFPVGAPGLFRHVQAPAEFLDFVNTPGRRFYALTIPDRDRNAWVKVEVYAYPLFICTRPGVLYSAGVSA